jgi:hypothetical protein
VIQAYLTGDAHPLPFSKSFFFFFSFFTPSHLNVLSVSSMGVFGAMAEWVFGFNFFLGVLGLWPNGWRRKVLGAFSVFGEGKGRE